MRSVLLVAIFAGVCCLAAESALLSHGLWRPAICYASTFYQGKSPYLGKPYEHVKARFSTIKEALESCGEEHKASTVVIILEDKVVDFNPSGFTVPERVKSLELASATNASIVKSGLGAHVHPYNVTLKDVTFDFSYTGDCSMGTALHWDIKRCTFLAHETVSCEAMFVTRSTGSFKIENSWFIGPNGAVVKIDDNMTSPLLVRG